MVYTRTLRPKLIVRGRGDHGLCRLHTYERAVFNGGHADVHRISILRPLSPNLSSLSLARFVLVRFPGGASLFNRRVYTKSQESDSPGVHTFPDCTTCVQNSLSLSLTLLHSRLCSLVPCWSLSPYPIQFSGSGVSPLYIFLFLLCMCAGCCCCSHSPALFAFVNLEAF